MPRRRLNYIEASGVEALAEALLHVPKLEKLELGCLPCNRLTFLLICRPLQSQHRCCQSRKMMLMQFFISSSSNAVHRVGSHNNPKESGSIALANCLQHVPNLQELNIG